jgi:hypothetical protein
MIMFIYPYLEGYERLLKRQVTRVGGQEVGKHSRNHCDLLRQKIALS